MGGVVIAPRPSGFRYLPAIITAPTAARRSAEDMNPFPAPSLSSPMIDAQI
jgi:hypothetical protein